MNLKIKKIIAKEFLWTLGIIGIWITFLVIGELSTGNFYTGEVMINGVIMLIGLRYFIMAVKWAVMTLKTKQDSD